MSSISSSLIKPEIQQLSPYQVPDKVYPIKLDAMENPYSLDVSFLEQWSQVLKTASLNRYPDPSAQTLKQQIRTTFAIPNSQELLLGNGSDELIQMLIVALNQPKITLVAVEPSFVMYRLIAQWMGMSYQGIPLQMPTFSLDMPALIKTLETHQPTLLFLAYPNNPTGNLFSDQDIATLLEINSGLIVIDEAYGPFTDHSYLSQLPNHSNLLIMRTLSKLGLAGLRLGFLAGSALWLEQINKVRLPYNINILTQITANFALQHYTTFQDQAQKIRQHRAALCQQLTQMDIKVWPSQANFLMFSLPNAVSIYQELKKQGILIKCLHGSHPLLENCLRVTIGTPEENGVFVRTLQTLLS